MYKISEVSFRLNVDTFLVYEKLMNEKEILKPYLHKVNGIKYIDETGLKLLRELIHNNSLPVQTLDDTVKEETVLKQEIENNTLQNDLQVDTDTDNSNVELDTKYKNEAEKNGWLTPDDLKLIEREKHKLKKEIHDLRSQISLQDSELKSLDEAIVNYQLRLQEDYDYLLDLELELSQKHLRSLQENEKSDRDRKLFRFMKK